MWHPPRVEELIEISIEDWLLTFWGIRPPRYAGNGERSFVRSYAIVLLSDRELTDLRIKIRTLAKPKPVKGELALLR
jgi:hypothetical protein